MNKLEVLRRLEDCGVIAVVQASSADQAIKTADACIAGGIAGIEITFNVPDTLDVIHSLCKKYPAGDVLIGAGTVLDPETARAAILAGAQYIVSPCLNADTLKLCLRYHIACMAGAMTFKEALECMEAGADIVKIFPAKLFGPEIITAFRGPLPNMRIVPTYGINIENAGEWIKAGAVAVGTGNDLIAGAKTGDYAAVMQMARRMVAEVKKARA
ncbi:MAG: bifunctional 2-keto-4-hydroxyglutarate aldolase/2-keto-3-deoxy-6-phosphogluconate aldolase [Clostridia bacterium]